ncbi:MAG TPA: sortase [Jatrophihabitantaceae bacterium]|nr:sortase [Jatrophihabitantaceae bacterium]
MSEHEPEEPSSDSADDTPTAPAAKPDKAAKPAPSAKPASSRPRFPAWLPFACIVGAIVLLAGAGVTWVISPNWGGGNNRSDGARNVGVVPTTSPVAVSLSLSPNRVEIPRLHAIAPVVRVANTADRLLEVPLDPKVVGWWQNGAKPGAKTGTAILDGHINYAGVQGTLAKIGTLNPGDDVIVYGITAGKHRTMHFKVTGVRIYRKTALPYAEIFDQKSIGRLALVTCGGEFDSSTGNYEENIVAFAVPA